MVDSNYIYVNTSKLYVEKTYREIPSFKPVRRTRLFSDEQYENVPGIQLYKKFSYYFGNNIVSIDRTNTITTPFRTKLATYLEIPTYEQQDLSYAECCDKRAKELLSLNKHINIMWSGGIDSTTMLSALLNNSTKNQQKCMTILLSGESITNNQKFYDDVICGNIHVAPSYGFDNYLGQLNSIFITAENNDELFGTNLIPFFIYRYNFDVLFEEPTVSSLFKILEKRTIIISEEDKQDMRKCIDIMFSIASKCPFELDTIYKFFWWLNFCLMWNVSYTRILGFAKLKTHPEENFFSFFSTKEFQLWSMNNVDNLIGDSWRTAKQQAKNYINEYHNNEHYRLNAIPSSNLSNICYNKSAPFAIDTDMVRIEIGDSISQFIQSQNSFI